MSPASPAASSADAQAPSTTAAGSAAATSESFTYDDRGQVMTATGSAGSTSYTYNGDGQVASVADAAGKASYTYDNVGRLATLTDPATSVTATYSYNPDSQISGVSYGSGNDTRSFSYDGQRRLASDTLKTSSGTVVAAQSYGYDPDGHLTSQTATNLAGPAHSTYTYDQAGRLATWNNGTTTTAYGYDGNGNLKQDGAKSYTYDARNELTGDGTGSYTYTARGTPSSEPGPSGSLTVAFDAYGDQATAGTSAYTYDAQGRLTAVTPATGAGQQLSYVGNTGAIASDGTSGYTWDPAGTSLFAAGNPGGGGGSLVLANAHGDVTGQFGPADTTLTKSRAYDPWGAVTAATGTMTGNLGYQSALTDPATGKDLMGARWYNPAAGDFTSADTIPQPPVPGSAAGNPYAYTGDDPLDHTDPDGHHIVLDSEDYIVAPGAAADLQVAIGLTSERLYQAYQAQQQAAKDKASGNANAAAQAEQQAQDLRGQAQAARQRVTTAAQAIDQAEAAAAAAGKNLIPADKPQAPNSDLLPAAARNNYNKYFYGYFQSVYTGFEKGSAMWLLTALFNFCDGSTFDRSVCGEDLARALWKDHLEAIAPLAIPEGGTGAAGEADPEGEDFEGTEVAPEGIIEERAAADLTKLRLGCLNSFTPDTRVLLPGGKTKPISSLKPGDKVLATSTTSGKTQPETITAVEVNHDTDLYDLTVKTDNGTQVVHTTASHLFYTPSLNYWIPAKQLKTGEKLKSPDGQAAVVVGGTTPKQHDGWMWDLTVPGNNDHDFYVIASAGSAGQLGQGSHNPSQAEAGDVPVLVHNSGPCGIGNALRNWSSQKFQFGNQQFLLDKSNMTHILERHMPEYWDGSVKASQSFFDKSMSIQDVQDAIGSVLGQNRDTLISRGSTGMYQIQGSYGGTNYILGLNNGHIGQFYPIIEP